MLPEIGASELLVIAVVALIVVGPKDLPGLLRKLGQFLAKIRGMAAEFRASFDEMARQSELDELRREVAAMRNATLAANPLTETADDITRSLNYGGGDEPHANPPPYMPQPPAELEAPAEPAPKPRRKAAAPKATAAAPAKPRAKKLVEGGPKRRGKIVEGGS